MKIIVVGGGAAGFFGAISANGGADNRHALHPDIQIVLLEASPQILTKVRISGGGRCNVTHACFDPAILVQNYPRGAKALRGAFSRFQPRDTIHWFEGRGVRLKTEVDGRIFPDTDDSATIVDCLIEAIRDIGVNLRTHAPVVSVVRQDEQFSLQLKSGEQIMGDRILLATGSSPQGHKIAKALGHNIIPPVPSLFTFNIADPRLQDLAGLSVDPVQLKLQMSHSASSEQSGACLITHWGLSGPAVLKLSAWEARTLQESGYQAKLLVNWLPQFNLERLREQLLKAKADFPKRLVSRYRPLQLPQRLWERLTWSAGINEVTQWSQLSSKALNALLQELTQGCYHIQGKGVFKEEFVTCGGVNLKEVDFKTMQSRICPGLYFAGEVLDIDGVTGGFNFQSAWTTGWIAGQAIAQAHL
jgi:predicted Rossmann fold flavoprotein